MERSGVLPTTRFAYRKCLGTCNALLCMSHTLKSILESGQEARILKIDFSEAIDMVSRKGIHYKLCSVGIEGSVLFLSNLSVSLKLITSLYSSRFSERSKLIDVVSGVT